MLREFDECQIRVETEVLDTEAGQNLGSTQFCSYTLSVDDGKVNFRQDLVECDKVKACRGNSVTLVVKVTLDARQNAHEFEVEDDFVKI